MDPARHSNFRIKARSGLLEANIQRIFEVATTIDLRTPTAARATPKEVPKDIVKGIRKPGTSHAAHATWTCARALINAGMSKAVISSTFAVIGQHFVRFFGLIKLFFGFGAIRITIGVILHGLAPIRLSDIVAGSIFLDSQKFVIVTF